MPVQIVERKRHLDELATLLTSLGKELQRATAQESPAAFEEGELADMLAALAIGTVYAAVRTALRCGASPRVVLAKLHAEISRS